MLSIGKKQSGFSLVEAMIAAAILIIAIMGISRYVTQSRDISIKIEGSSECYSDIQSLINNFSDSSNLKICNYIPNSIGAGAACPVPLASVRRELSYAFNPIYNGYGNYQNIENAATIALQMYNARESSGQDICFANGGLGIPATAQMFSDQDLFNRISNPNKQIFLNITPVQMNDSSNIALCPNAAGTLNMHPLSTANPGGNNLGMKVRITIRPTPGNQTVIDSSTCRAELIAKYSLDTSPPTMGGGVLNTDCAAHTATISGLTSSEPGSMFECSTDNVSYVDCRGFSPFGSGSDITVTNPGFGQPNTQINLIMRGVPQPVNQPIYVRAVDTAANKSAVPAGPFDVTCGAPCVTNWNGACVGNDLYNREYCMGVPTGNEVLIQANSPLCAAPPVCSFASSYCAGISPGPCTTHNVDTCGVDTDTGVACACAVGPPVDCAGVWSGCSAPCGPGLETTFTITQTPANGGLACPNPAAGACNLGACPPPPPPPTYSYWIIKQLPICVTMVNTPFATYADAYSFLSGMGSCHLCAIIMLEDPDIPTCM